MKHRLFFALTFLLGSMIVALPGSADAQIRMNRITTTQVDTVLRRIETRTDNFKRSMETSLDQSRINNTNREDRIMDLVRDFEVATDVLRREYANRRDLGNELNEVMGRAALIDRFMSRNQLATRSERQWSLIKADLNTLAGYYSFAWDWNRVPSFPANPGDVAIGGGSRINNITTRQVDTVLRRIETRTDNFKRSMETSLDRSQVNNTNREDRIMDLVRDFETATDVLRREYVSRRDLGNELNEVMGRAARIDQFMTRNRLNTRSEQQWNLIKTDLNTLAGYYSFAWDWNRVPAFPTEPGTIPVGGTRRFDRQLSGTYRLNRTLSDNASEAIRRQTSSYSMNQNQLDRLRTNLERRLIAPEMLAIEADRRSVTMASSLAPQVTFDADGVARTETTANGRTIRTTATLDRDDLTIAYEGDRSRDFYVTFQPDGTNRLRVTRRIYVENQNDQITVTSVYDKIDNIARWDSVNTGTSVPVGPIGGNVGRDFYIPNGTRLTATLENPVNSRASQVGDRFTMQVTSPARYRGAIIEGRVTDAGASGRFSGRANLTFDFDTIRYGGRQYRFAGIIDSVRAANGDNVSINNEGTVRDTNQTTRTVTRAGIGGVLGALIGAIAGGGEGAAIGAAIGAGAGAGTVLIQGRDNIELGVGTEFTITATGPNTVGIR